MRETPAMDKIRETIDVVPPEMLRSRQHAIVLGHKVNAMLFEEHSQESRLSGEIVLRRFEGMPVYVTAQIKATEVRITPEDELHEVLANHEL